MKRQKITLNEWFEEWFANYKIPNIKETSVFPMRSKYYNTNGYLLDIWKAFLTLVLRALLKLTLE